MFVVNLAFITTLYKKNVSFNVDNVKTINDTFSLTIMAEDISNYGQEVFISVSVTLGNTRSLDYILWNYFVLTLISFCVSIFCKKRVLKVVPFNFYNFSVFAKSQAIQLILI